MISKWNTVEVKLTVNFILAIQFITRLLTNLITK